MASSRRRAPAARSPDSPAARGWPKIDFPALPCPPRTPHGPIILSSSASRTKASKRSQAGWSESDDSSESGERPVPTYCFPDQPLPNTERLRDRVPKTGVCSVRQLGRGNPSRKNEAMCSVWDRHPRVDLLTFSTALAYKGSFLAMWLLLLHLFRDHRTPSVKGGDAAPGRTDRPVMARSARF
jgi:hypothetical protein